MPPVVEAWSFNYWTAREAPPLSYTNEEVEDQREVCWDQDQHSAPPSWPSFKVTLSVTSSLGWGEAVP